MILMEWQYNKICQFLAADIYPFQKKMKHWKLDKIGYWEIGAGCLVEIGLAPVLQIVQKISEK